MNVKITVTAEDIAAGEPGEGCECPIALAIERSLPERYVFVSQETIRLGRLGGDVSVPVRTPPEAAEFVYRFDHREHVEPFEFALDVPGDLAPAVAGE